MRVEASAAIDRPLIEVWEFCVVQHEHNHPRWDPDIRIEQQTDGPVGLGTVFTRWSTRHGTPTEGTMEVIGFEPLRSMRTRIKDGSVTILGQMSVVPEGPTRTLLTIGGDFPGFDDAMEAVIRPLMQRSLANIQRLLAESPAQPPGTRRAG
jgi:hypothetical protein